MYRKHTVAYIFPDGGGAGWYSAEQVTTSDMLLRSAGKSLALQRFIAFLRRRTLPRHDVTGTTVPSKEFANPDIFPAKVFRRTVRPAQGAR